MANPGPINNTIPQNYSIDQILQATQPTKQPGGFRKVLGSLVGGVGNMFAPGIGSLIGGTISGSIGGIGGGVGGIGGSIGIGAGGAGAYAGFGSEPMQYLQLQQQMEQESEAYETASMVLKSRHDASMQAIRNIS